MQSQQQERQHVGHSDEGSTSTPNYQQASTGPPPRPRRADMDRIKSRAVDPGWNWETEKDRYERGPSIDSIREREREIRDRSNSNQPLPSAPGFGDYMESHARRPSLPSSSGSIPPSRQGSGSGLLSTSQRTSQQFPPPTRPLPPRIDTQSPPVIQDATSAESDQYQLSSVPRSATGVISSNLNGMTLHDAPPSSHPGQRMQAATQADTGREPGPVQTSDPKRSVGNEAVDSRIGRSEREGKGKGEKETAIATSVTPRRRDQNCAACQKPMTGQFVRALNTVYHLDCFRCKDCNKVVAGKFFPATDSPDTSLTDQSGTASGANGKLFPLCERDYFRRLNLLCNKCEGALRGSYITALGMKFHVEHFTCSICPTVFGPQDSYYEHDGRVFCHFHYSTRFAIRCTGCRIAILKQFVEINRNNRDEYWHPECYMIHKFWNLKLAPTGSTPKNGTGSPELLTNGGLATSGNAGNEGADDASGAAQPSHSESAPVPSASATDAPSAEALETEALETPSSLKAKQKSTEEQVYRIWTVLSAFEESSAACISEMLRHVSSGRYLNGVRMAERFIFHVEILFSTIDQLEREFKKENTKGISHIREARMLCKKIVNFFSLLSNTQETGARRMNITQELLALVTGLAHYLKILIRIALTGALKLDREYGNHAAIEHFLDSLAHLAREAPASLDDASPISPADVPAAVKLAKSSSSATNGLGAGPSSSYGYQSLPRSTTSSETGETATDLCVSCGQTVEEECVRSGINMRWHTSCVKCTKCNRAARKEVSAKASKPVEAVPAPIDKDGPEPWPATQFAVEITRKPEVTPSAQHSAVATSSSRVHSTVTMFCAGCAGPHTKNGFDSVTRLEQYAFLLRVALNRLYALLKKRGVVPATPPEAGASSDLPSIPADEEEGYSGDMKRIKSVSLDRKLSTKAKVPRISTVVGSPSGQTTLPSTNDQRPSPTDSSSGAASPGRRGSGSDRPRSPRSSPYTHDTTVGSSSPQRRSPSDSDRDRAYSNQHPLQHQQIQGGYPRVPPRSNSREVSPSNNNTLSGGPLAPRGTSPVQFEQGSIVPIRPAFARHNTDVRIRDDGPRRQPSAEDDASAEERPNAVGGLDAGGHNDGAGDGITLADIPHMLEIEQAREQHRPLPTDGGRLISELSALELFVIKHMAVMILQQTALRDLVQLDDLFEFIETRKNTFWGKIFKGGKEKKDIKKKGVFGVPLEILVERNGADSTLGASAAHLRVPSFVDDIIAAMKQMDVSIEGIFRKNGNIRRLKDLSEALDRDASTVNLSDDNPVQLAALLKKFLRELPDPVLTFKLHRLFVMSQKIEDEEDRVRILHLVSVLLPKAHRDTLEVLFVFLKWVASFSHIDEETGSKMDLQNLATVLGPNLLYSKGTDPAKDETFLANRAVLLLLERQDHFWTVPAELEAVLYDRELLSTSADATSRDILKRCEKFNKRQRAATGGKGSFGPASGSRVDASHGEMSNRHRPDMHGPATMRQVLHHQQQQQQMQQQQMQQGAGGQHPYDPSGMNGFVRSPVAESAGDSINGGAPWPTVSSPTGPTGQTFASQVGPQGPLSAGIGYATGSGGGLVVGGFPMSQSGSAPGSYGGGNGGGIGSPGSGPPPGAGGYRSVAPQNAGRPRGPNSGPRSQDDTVLVEQTSR